MVRGLQRKRDRIKEENISRVKRKGGTEAETNRETVRKRRRK